MPQPSHGKRSLLQNQIRMFIFIAQTKKQSQTQNYNTNDVQYNLI